VISTHLQNSACLARHHRLAAAKKYRGKRRSAEENINVERRSGGGVLTARWRLAASLPNISGTARKLLRASGVAHLTLALAFESGAQAATLQKKAQASAGKNK